MNRIVTARWATLTALVLFCLALPGCKGCTPNTVKTIELTPVELATGSSGTAGSLGWCLSAGNVPMSPFSPGAGQVMVGFDNFFRAGSGPFPCDDLRAVVFRGVVRFDLSQFDSVGNSTLLFDAQNSIQRSGGETIGTSPATSHATTLGVATQANTGQQPFANDVGLPATHAINIGVASQVQDWVQNTRPNLGFVVAGPTGLVNTSNPPKDNDAKISWYGNFRLRVTYNPAQNPRAPQ